MEKTEGIGPIPRVKLRRKTQEIQDLVKSIWVFLEFLEFLSDLLYRRVRRDLCDWFSS